MEEVLPVGKEITPQSLDGQIAHLESQDAALTPKIRRALGEHADAIKHIPEPKRRRQAARQRGRFPVIRPEDRIVRAHGRELDRLYNERKGLRKQISDLKSRRKTLAKQARKK